MNTDGPYWRGTDHDGVRIIELDLRGCSGEEIQLRHAEFSRAISGEPEKSVLCLTLARGVRYDPRYIKILVRQMKEIDRYVFASAVVGLDHLTKLVNVLNGLSGRSLRAFDDVESAVAWLLATRRQRAKET